MAEQRRAVRLARALGRGHAARPDADRATLADYRAVSVVPAMQIGLLSDAARDYWAQYADVDARVIAFMGGFEVARAGA